MMKLKLMHNDVLIKPKNKNDFVNTTIFLGIDKREDDINFYEVVDVSDKVTSVKPGNIILLESSQHTIPMIWKNVMSAITSEEYIIAIIED